jgi:hypothetical protein
MLQGKGSSLGTFSNPITAAKCYDKAARKAHGAAAVLNFPSGCKPTPTSRGATNRSPMKRSTEGCGQEGATTPGLEPPGNPGGQLVRIPGILSSDGESML